MWSLLEIEIVLPISFFKLEDVKVKLATLVKGDTKAPLSIATTPRCRGGRYSFRWIVPLYRWSVPYNAEC